MKLHSDRRKGFALAVALAALVVIGGLIVGVFFASTEHYRVGRNTVLQQRALAAAEYGLYGTLADPGSVSSGGWDSRWNDSSAGMVTAAPMVFNPPKNDGSFAAVTVTALGNGTYHVTSEGRAGSTNNAGAQARRRIGALVALKKATPNMPGALTTKGNVITLKGTTEIHGTDQRVTAWGKDCPPANTGKAGIAIKKGAKIDGNGNCKDNNCIYVTPPNEKVKVSDDAADGDTYSTFGDVSYKELAASAPATHTFQKNAKFTKVQFSTVTKNNVTSCNYADGNNWGNPMRTSGGVCSDFFPIMHALGDLDITGGYGQGILLVDGNLTVSGNFEFYGLVIVQGGITSTGGGGHFNGGVMVAHDLTIDKNDEYTGSSILNYSSCALEKALNANAARSLANGRSWVELF